MADLLPVLYFKVMDIASKNIIGYTRDIKYTELFCQNKSKFRDNVKEFKECGKFRLKSAMMNNIL